MKNDRIKDVDEFAGFIREKIGNRLQEGSYQVPLGKMGKEFLEENFGRFKNFIYLEAIGAGRNKESLKALPHVQMGDLAAVYMIRIDVGGGATAKFPIGYGFLKNLSLTTDWIHRTAVENSKRDYPAVLVPMDKAAREMGITLPTEGKNLEEAIPMHILTNTDAFHGASVLFYPAVLDNLDVRFPGGFYVLPSSVHECIILPKSGEDLYDGQELSELVQKINRDLVRPEEQLSDQAHEYDRARRSLAVAEAGKREPCQTQEEREYTH